MSSKKSMLYKKLFFTYTLVVICLIGSFDFYLVNYVISNSKSSRLNLGEKFTSDIIEMLKEVETSNKYVVNKMYYDPMLTNDIINFLSHHTNDYLKNKLDSFASNNEFTYGGVEKFVAQSFVSNDKIETMIFLSKTLDEARTFNNLNQIQTTKIEDYDEKIKDLPNLFFYEDKLFYVNAINNPNNLTEEGKLVIGYDLEGISQIISKYGTNYNVLLLDENSQTIYLPEEGINQFINEDLSVLINLEQGDEYKTRDSISVIKSRFSNNLSIISEINMKGLVESPQIFYSSLVLLDFTLIILTLPILKFKLEKLAQRTDKILQVMEEVKEGNLKARIPLGTEVDEISYISENFNEMCLELDKYINKSYLAEINQKKAEMIALQNQINPHFLYNTLECIRMKAVSNGDKEVGKMLYNLAFLFRKQVKDKNLITLESELEYCIKYMNIFKFRYSEKFDFKINCPEELYNNEIIKFTIQPLIENYFVHGIRLEENNNFIEINVTKENEVIKIIIDDNGRGISEEKLEVINRSISIGPEIDHADQSIGIVNAQSRIVGTYGEEYGIKLDNNSQGARVIIIIPCKIGGVTDEKSYAS